MKKKINFEKASTFERVLAFIIDLLVVSAISLLLTFWMPLTKEYHDAAKKIADAESKFKDDKITEEAYFKIYENENYIQRKESITQSAINIVVMIGYYVTFVFYYGGQTLGKKWLKIRLIDNEENVPNQLKLFVRSGIINNLFFSIVSLGLLPFISKDNYLFYFKYISMGIAVLWLVILFMVTIRKDKKGLHDLLLKTDVVKM